MPKRRQWGGTVITKAVSPNFSAMAASPGGRLNSPEPRAFPLLDAINAATGELVANGGTNGLMGFQGYPRDPSNDSAFGPMDPLVPEAIDQLDSDGHTAPRSWQYTVGWNLPGNGNRETPWQVLRAAAAGVGIIRRCIEARKKDVADLSFVFAPSEDAINDAYQLNPNAGRLDAEQKLREELMPEIVRLREFWANPWKARGLDFKQWCRMVLEHVLVDDAVPIYPSKTYGGDVYDLEVIDPSTIKPLLDSRGNRPSPPFPAFQQILYGFPRGEWAATTELDEAGNLIIPNGFGSSQMMYYVANPRTFSPYGYSPVEMALFDSRLYLQRQKWMIAEYDDGSTPLTWIETAEPKDGKEMTLTQQRLWERAFNAKVAGNTRERARAKVLPNGWKAMQMTSVDERYRPEYDLYLIKLLASYFGVTATRLGFGETNGLGGSGFSESQMAVTGELGLKPDTEVLTAIINEASCKFLGMDKRIAGAFVDPAQANSKEQIDGAVAQQGAGQISVNEVRQKLGQSLLPFKEANMPFVLGGPQGIIFLEGAKATIEAAMQAQQMQAETSALGTAGKLSLEEKKIHDGKEARKEEHDFQREAREAEAVNEVKKAAEISAFRSWRRKPGNRGDQPRRPFVFKCVTPDDGWPELEGLSPLVAEFDGYEWIWDEEIEKAAKKAAKSPFDYIEWNARNPLHPKGPNGRWVKRGSDLHTALIEEGKRHAEAHAPKPTKPLQDEVTEAYGKLRASSESDLVSLVRLRHELSHVDQDELTAELKRMDRARLLQLDPDPNRKALPPEARQAAIQMGGEDKHFLSMRASGLVGASSSLQGMKTGSTPETDINYDPQHAIDWRRWSANPRPIQAYTIPQDDDNGQFEKHGAVLPDRNVLISKNGRRLELIDSVTDEVLFTGSSKPDLWRQVSAYYGAPVDYEHEGTHKRQTFGQAGDPMTAPAAAKYAEQAPSVPETKPKVPKREGKVKRGDLLVVEQRHPDFRGTEYPVFQVTSVTREGAPRMMQKLGWESVPLAVDRFLGLDMSRSHVIPAEEVDVDAIKMKLKAHTYPNSNTPLTYDDLKTLRDEVLLPHTRVETPADTRTEGEKLQDAAVARLAVADAARARSMTLARVEEALINETDAEPLARMMQTAALVNGVQDDPDFVSWHTTPADQVPAHIEALAAKLGFERLDDVTGGFDPARHEPIGNLRRGQKVDLVRPGYATQIEGERRVLHKPKVEEAYDTPETKSDGATFWSSRSTAEEPFQRGQRVIHRRGQAVFRGLDDMDTTGDTAWVDFLDGDAAGDGLMVTTRHLLPAMDPHILEGDMQIMATTEDAAKVIKHLNTAQIMEMSEALGRGRITADMPDNDARMAMARAARGRAPRREKTLEAPPIAAPVALVKPGRGSAGYVTSAANAHSLKRGDLVVVHNQAAHVVGHRREGNVIITDLDDGRTIRTSVNEPFRRVTGGAAGGGGISKAAVPDDGPGGADPKEQGSEGEPTPTTPPPTTDHSWPGWVMDLVIASLVAQALIAAMSGPGLGISALLGSFLEWTRGYRPGDPVPDVGAWLREVAPGDPLGRIVDAITPAIRQAHTEGAFVGQQSAQAALEYVQTGGNLGDDRDPALQLSVNWGDWVPGHPEAAQALLEPGGLERLLYQSNAVIKGIANNRLDEVGRILGEGLAQGHSPAQIGRALRELGNDAKWAHMTALTETNRAQSYAAVMEYRRAGLKFKGWMTAFDQRVCKICDHNAHHEDGRPRIVPIDELFPSGDPWPPGHPRCRCAPIPILNLDFTKAVSWVQWNIEHPLHPKGPDGQWVVPGFKVLDEDAYAEAFGFGEHESVLRRGLTARLGSDETVHLVNDLDEDHYQPLTGRLDETALRALAETLKREAPLVGSNEIMGSDLGRAVEFPGDLSVWPLPDGSVHLTRTSDSAAIASLNRMERFELHDIIDYMVTHAIPDLRDRELDA